MGAVLFNCIECSVAGKEAPNTIGLAHCLLLLKARYSRQVWPVSLPIDITYSATSGRLPWDPTPV